MTRLAALQRTPDGAAELGCALTPSGPLPSRALRGKSRAVRYTVATRPAPRWPAPPGQKSGACAQDNETGSSRHRAGCCLAGAAGEVAAQLHITGCCTHARRAVRRAHSRRACAQPPLCLAPTPRLRGASARSTEPMPRQYRCSCAPGVPAAQVMEPGAASGAVIELAPARHPSAPRGGSRALSTVLPSVAPCSPRQGQALRAREYARP